MGSTLELDLFVDESGTFTEKALLSGEERPGRARIPSQLVGVLAPAGQLHRGVAEEILAHAFGEAGLPLGEEVHACELPKGSGYQRVVEVVAREIQRRGWQVVRLVNLEALGYGDRVANQCHQLAELILRILQQKAREGYDRITLEVTCASVRLNPDQEEIELLDEAEYSRHIREYLTFLAVRRSMAPQTTGWTVKEPIHRGSGRFWRTLQLCDLLSNASAANFKNARAPLKAVLQQAMGPYNQSLRIRAHHEMFEALVEEGSLGRALQLACERAIAGPSMDRRGQEESASLLARCVADLLALSAPQRRVHLMVLIAWLEQLVEQSRSVRLAADAAAWLDQEVLTALTAGLGEADPAGLAHFEASLLLWRLTSANHGGDLVSAAEWVRRSQACLPRLARHGESSELVASLLVASAVHLTDLCEYAVAARQMEAVSAYHEGLTGMMGAALPDVFPDEVWSIQRGKALGTLTQAEMYASLEHPERANHARRNSDLAMGQLRAWSDQARQAQYRCQLETYQGKLVEAREWLAMALRVEESSHARLAEVIAGLTGIDRAFALLHWLRLGVWCYRQGDSKEATGFNRALRGPLLELPELVSAGLPYPAHGCRRFAAFSLAASGNTSGAMGMLKQLRDLRASAPNSTWLSLIDATAHCEVAALSWVRSEIPSRRLLLSEGKGDPIGALKMLRMLPMPAGASTLQRRVQSLYAAAYAMATAPKAGAQHREEVLEAARLIAH